MIHHSIANGYYWESADSHFKFNK